MINYNKNNLINETLDKYYETFGHTLDTSDFVPDKFNAKISRYIFKNMKKAFKRIDKEDRRYQKTLRKESELKERNDRKINKQMRKESKVNEQKLNADSNHNS